MLHADVISEFSTNGFTVTLRPLSRLVADLQPVGGELLLSPAIG